MKSSIFYRFYFILYSVLLLVIFCIVKLDRFQDFDILKIIYFFLLPVVSLLLAGILVWIKSKLGISKIKEATESTTRKKFNSIFFIVSFFIPFVCLAMMIILNEFFNYSFSDSIYILCFQMLASYIIGILFSLLFGRLMCKLKNNITPVYKIYLVLYPIILLMLSLSLFLYQNMIAHNRNSYQVDRLIIFSLPIAITFLSFIIACIIVIIKQKNNEVSLSIFTSFCKLFFIASLITTFLNTVIFLFLINRSDVNFEYISEPLVYFFITSFILTILIAFAIKPVIHYWKFSKVTSILFFIIYAQILFGLFYVGNQILNARDFMSDYYEYHHRAYDGTLEGNSDLYNQSVVTQEQVVESDIDDESETEDQTKPFYLNFLWEKPSADKQNITNALQEVRDSYNYDVIFSNIPYLKESEKPNPIYKIVQYVSNNRKNIDLSKLLETYSSLITTVIPKSIYEKNRYDMMLKLLCDSYYDLVDYDENKEMHRMKAVYEVMYNSGGDYRDKFELIKPYISKSYRKKYDYFGADFDDFSDYQQLVWAYSFWGRRYNEGNVEGTIVLLHDIRNLYDDYEEEY